MILYPLQFVWIFNEDSIEFNVRQNPEHVLWERYYSIGKIPPLNERVKYLRLAGKSERVINKLVKFYTTEKKNSEKNQKIIDDIFLKFNVKPAKKKVFKPVKKL